MSERDYILFLEDILKSAEKIIKYVGNKSFEEFVQDEILTDAVIRNLEIIGEAVKNLPKEIKQETKRIDWKKIAGLRDILIHGYFGINYKILWEIAKDKIPLLKKETEAILKPRKQKE